MIYYFAIWPWTCYSMVWRFERRALQRKREAKLAAEHLFTILIASIEQVFMALIRPTRMVMKILGE